MIKYFSLLILLAQFNSADCQKPNIKFGNVNLDDFKKSVYEIDSNANAIVLYDYCIVKYEGDNSSDFNVIYKYHKRIKLLNKNSFDLATISIPLQKNSTYEEKIEKLEAVTYNIENNKIIASKVDKSSLFKDKITKNYQLQKFTLPNLKEGSIIEYTYTLSSPFSRDIKDWHFQGSDPVLWSEYDITVPSIFNFITLRQGYQPFEIDSVSGGKESYNILLNTQNPGMKSEVYTFNTNTFHSVWAMKNIPALKKEKYTSTLNNHIAKIEFQLSSIKYPDQPVKPIMLSWNQVVEQMLKSEDFGVDIFSKNAWLSDELKIIVKGATSKDEKAKKIFEYVRDNFSCTNHDAIYLSNSIKKIFQTKTGNVADINLLLVAMLIHDGFDAKPVILSTRENGRAFDDYPIMSKFNYVICLLKIDSINYFLDASVNKLGFGKIPLECYNGNGRTITTNSTLVDLSPSSIIESKLTTLFFFKGNTDTLLGTFTSKPGYYESLDLRDEFVKTSDEEYFKNKKKSLSFETEIENGEIENKKNYEDLIKIKFDFKMPLNDEDIIYFNPMFGEEYKTNPFNATQRNYPVEMPFVINETFLLNMEVPEGYKVDELPKSVRINFNENDGKFEYIILLQNGLIQFRCLINFNKAIFEPEEYESLRNFFAYIVKKQSEQIVLKKIKD